MAASAAALPGCGEADEDGPAGATTTAESAPTTDATTTTEEAGATEETTTDATGASPTRGPRAYRQAADELCSDAMARQEAARRESGDQLTLDDRARLLVDLAPPRILLAERLNELEPPPEDAALHRRLVASAERRGAASARAGRLWQRGGSVEKIEEAAAVEHDERLLAVEISKNLGLTDCAERLSPGELDEIAAVAETALGTGPAGPRCRTYGGRYLVQEYGDLAGCRRGEPPAPLSEKVKVREAVGMDDVFAVARVQLDSGSWRLRLTHERGGFKVDKLD